MLEYQKPVKLFKFNGCHGSYRKMLRRLHPDKDPRDVCDFLLPDFKPSPYRLINGICYWPKFYGIVRFRENGLVMQKDDHYLVEIKK